MEKRNKLRTILLACVMSAFTGFAGVSRADDMPTTGPATAPMAGAKRGVEQILADFTVASQSLRTIFTSPAVLTDAAKRTAAAPTAIPALQKMLALTDEMIASADPRGPMLGKQVRNQLLPILVAFGDTKAKADLEKQAASSDPAVALQSKSALLMANWIQSSSDAAAQTKLIDDATALAKANPESPELAQTLMAMSQLSATPAAGDKLQAIVVDNMKGEIPEQIKQTLVSEKKLKSIEGKPLAIAGKTVDGTEFSTDSWKGKVILVDFWATWCGPCKEELPRVKKAYADFHGKGLEVLGVSNDYKAEDLKKFVAADPAMPWTQLFDEKAATGQQWNPITTGFGIDGIPTMFLIDKKGVCRTVSARENFEELIPKMLAE